MSGGIVAIVPIRSLTGGKTRLGTALSASARSALTQRMLDRVVGAAADSGTISRVIVVSPDQAALDYATARHPIVEPLLQEVDRPGLIGGLEQARDHALATGAGGLLILFGDLPLIEGEDVRTMVRRDAAVVIAPDRHGAGTNALFLRPTATPSGQPGFRFQFGEGSYGRHIAEAHRLGLDVTASVAGGTAFDLDTPEDLAALPEAIGADVLALSSEHPA